MYRGRDEDLRAYESKKKFYLMKLEELEEISQELRKCSEDAGVPAEFLERMQLDFDQRKQELERLREETLVTRRRMEERLRRLDRQVCEVLYLKYIKQLTVSEICAKLCYSMQRIYQLLNKGVDLYRTKFCSYPEERCL